MTLGIMQPYFLPYLGYFELIRRADRWVVFDTAQFIRHGWVNRNRILHPSDGWQYIRAPVARHSNRLPISEVRIADRAGWRERLIAQLGHYRRRAPFYVETVAMLEPCLAGSGSSLSRLNLALLEAVCERLELRFEPLVWSAADVPIGPVTAPGDWALRISEALGADEYVNPPGGAEIFDPSAFRSAGVTLTLLEPRPMTYAPSGYRFVPDLSIVDVMMWNPPWAIREHLDDR